MNSSKKTNSRKFGVIISTVALVVFLGIAGTITAISNTAYQDYEEQTIADTNNVPKTWNSTESRTVVANSSLSGKVIDTKYIQFTATVSNANSGDSLYLTHIASYLAEDENVGGFIPLNASSLEYSYTPDNSDSWTTIGVNNPSNEEDAFKLAGELHLGAAGTATDTIYFRFYVEPETETEKVNSKIAFLMRNSKGDTGYSDGVATIDYLNAKTVIATTTTTDASELAADNPELATSDAHVDPLGRFSFVPNLTVLTSSMASTSGFSTGLLTVGIAAIGIGAVIFTICLVAYLPIARKK